MECNYYKLIYLSLIFVSFISLGFCGEKRNRDDAESSMGRENKSARYLTDLASSLPSSSERRIEDATLYKKTLLLNLVEWIDKFELECTPSTLMELLKFRDEIPEAKITKYLKSCDEQAKQWLDEKIVRLGGIGGMIRSWSNAIALFISEDNDFMNQKNVRLVESLVFKFQVTYQRTKKVDLHGIESTENSRRAYYYGDGLCVHILSSPFDKIEVFMEMVLRDFENLKYVKDFKKPIPDVPAGITIYTFQKICRRLIEMPKVDYQNSPIKVSLSIGLSKNLAREAFEGVLKDIRRSTKRGYNCEWPTLFNHKLLYRFLDHLRGNQEFDELKKIADDSIDSLVWHCLSELGSTEHEFQIFDSIKGSSDEHLFPALLELMKETFELYPLQPDQSINEALDIRAPNNGFRKHLMTEITKLLTDSNTDERLANHFIDLLLGHLDVFQKLIYKRSNYKTKIVSLELPEFLFHVFSIKGYRPKFSSPLFGFYYLHAVNEICNMIPIDISKIISSRLALKKQSSGHAQANKSTAVEQISEYQKDALEKINAFETVCNLEALHELSYFNNEAADSFLNKCDSQAREWFEKKIKKIDTFGLMIERWMKSVAHFVGEILEIEPMPIQNIGGDERLVKKVRKSITYKKFGDKTLDDETDRSCRLALNYGDGICVHILSPPFDQIENFMEAVLSQLGQLNYVNNVRARVQATANLKIYILQKFCRHRYANPTRMRLYQVIQTMRPIDKVEAANINFQHMLKMIESEKEDSFSCEGIEVFNFKQGYHVLHLLPNSSDKRQMFDKLLDRRVEICLSKFADEGAIRVFAETMNTSTQAMLSTVLETLLNAIKSYPLAPDQSINKALDIRSPKNGFKQLLITQIKDKIVQSSNKELARLFTHLLKGYFQHESSFIDTIYENKQVVEYKLIEFLFQVFDIEGYKPQISSPLLGIYYLYKISEICDMIPVD